ncbi:MAG: hypothetical protein HY238_01135 [Acidobacteria bacterium]|nr:hypothetical protein [Acidobacteriota bacterium]
MKRKRQEPKAPRVALAILGVAVAGSIFWAVRQPDASSTTSPQVAPSQPTEQVPPYYESEEAARPFPVTLPPEYFRAPYIAQAYRVARQIPAVLAQQPCYCYCYRFGHGSLLDCYKDNHGAG